MKNKKLWAWMSLILGMLVVFGLPLLTLSKKITFSPTLYSIFVLIAGFLIVAGLVIKALK